MFKSLDSIASVVGICMYLTISKIKQVLRSRKGLDCNTAAWHWGVYLRLLKMIPDVKLVRFIMTMIQNRSFFLETSQ